MAWPLYIGTGAVWIIGIRLYVLNSWEFVKLSADLSEALCWYLLSIGLFWVRWGTLDTEERDNYEVFIEFVVLILWVCPICLVVGYVFGYILGGVIELVIYMYGKDDCFKTM